MRAIKKFLALLLATATGLSLFAGCGSDAVTPETTVAPTEAKEAKTSLKVLTLGHSLAVDSCYMLSLIAAAEGYTELTVGTLYYSGCALSRHVQYMTTDAREYRLYISNSADVSTPRETIEDITMGEAVRFTDWDVIVLQGSTFEVAEDTGLTNGNIQLLQKFVNDNKLNPDAVFAWHLFWSPATDPELIAMHPTKPDPITGKYVKYDTDRIKLFDAMAQCVGKYISTDETFQFVIPSGTAFENAMTCYMEENELLRDYGHANDLGRLITGYTWYCTLRGIDHLEALKLTTIPKAYFKSTVSNEDRVLTEHEQALVLESVNHALKNPLQITQSTFTERPAQ